MLNAHTNYTEALSRLWEALVCPMPMTRTITTTARTPRRAVATTDDSESIEAGTSSPGLDNVREIGEMDEDTFYMLRGIV